MGQSVPTPRPIQPVSCPAIMTPVLSLLLTVLALTQGSTSDTTPDIMELEKTAFKLCESDHTEGLTWDEVEECEDTYGEELLAQGLAVPSYQDFKDADTNGDGILMFEEWMDSMGMEEM